MTPEEAKEKWCPFARVIVAKQKNDANIVGVPVSFNRIAIARSDRTILDSSTKCMADKCMAWRWSEQPAIIPAPPQTGYCGLAGEP